MDLPELDQQKNIDVLSRIISGIHEKVQREVERPASDSSASAGHPAEEAGAAAAKVVDEDHGACADASQSEPSSSSHPPEAQPFVLPLGVMARNEVYPRTCRKW